MLRETRRREEHGHGPALRSGLGTRGYACGPDAHGTHTPGRPRARASPLRAAAPSPVKWGPRRLRRGVCKARGAAPAAGTAIGPVTSPLGARELRRRSCRAAPHSPGDEDTRGGRRTPRSPQARRRPPSRVSSREAPSSPTRRCHPARQAPASPLPARRAGAAGVRGMAQWPACALASLLAWQWHPAEE